MQPQIIPVSVAEHEEAMTNSIPPWVGSSEALPSALNLPVPIYTPEWREAL